MSRARDAAAVGPGPQDPGHGAGRPWLTRTLILNCAVLAVLAIATVATLLIQHGRYVGPAYYSGPYAPVTVTASNTVTMAQPGVRRPVVDVYEDFQCPVCDEFEGANGAALQQLAYQGQVKVVYHVFTIFVGSQPRQANSTRAWAAARCVPAGRWIQYHNLLYANQPPELTAGGFPIRQLLALGSQLGLTSPAFTRCVSSQQYAPELVPLSNRLTMHGVNSTPAILLDGHHISVGTLVTPGITLRQMILAAH